MVAGIWTSSRKVSADACKLFFSSNAGNCGGCGAASKFWRGSTIGALKSGGACSVDGNGGNKAVGSGPGSDGALISGWDGAAGGYAPICSFWALYLMK